VIQTLGEVAGLKEADISRRTGVSAYNPAILAEYFSRLLRHR
jgi:hypothetical protein